MAPAADSQTLPLVFMLLLCVGTALKAPGMIRGVEWRQCWLGCQKEVSRNQGQWGHGQQLSLRPLRASGPGQLCLQLSGRLWAGRSLGLEVGGAGNVELALAQSGLRAVYSWTLGISRAFPQGFQGIPTGSRTVEGM